jgi:hypothetical protein
MIEAYEIGVSIVMDTNIPGSVGNLIKAYEQLNDAIMKAQGSARAFNDAMKGTAGAAKRFADLAASIDKMATGAKRAADATAGMASSAKTAAKDSADIAANFERAAKAAGALVSAPRLLTYQPGGSSGGGYTALPGGGGYGPPAPNFGRPVYGGGGDGGGSGSLPPGGGYRALPGGGGRGIPAAPSNGSLVPYGAGGGGGGGMPPIFPWPQPNGPRPPGGRGTPPVGAAVGAGIVSSILTGALNSIWQPTADVGAIESQMLQAGFTQAQVDAAMGAAVHAQQTIVGATIPGAMQSQLEIGTLLSNPGAAARMLPAMAGLGVTLGQYGHGDQVESLFAAIQAGELHGALSGKDGQLDPAKLINFMHEVQAAQTATGGRIGPDQILAYLKTAGVSGRVINDSDLFGGMIATMLSMGATRAGTGLQSFYQQFGVGRMSDASFNLLNSMGLVADPSKAAKIGGGQRRLSPGGLAGQSYVDSGDFMGYLNNVLLPGIHKYDEKTYGTDNADLQSKTAASISQRLPGGRWIADLITLAPLVKSYTDAIKGAEGRDASSIAQSTNPKVIADGAGAAGQSVLIAAGQGALPMLNSQLNEITTAFNSMATVLRSSPLLSTLLVGTGEGIGVLAGGLAAFVGGAAAIRGLKALTSFALETEVFGVLLGEISGPLVAAAGLIWAANKALNSIGSLEGKVLDWTFGDKTGFNAALSKTINGLSPPSQDELQNLWNQYHSGSPQSPVHVIVVNHDDVGNSMVHKLGRGLTRPLSGPTGYDARMGLPPSASGGQ